MKNCIFCQIMSDNISAHKIWEDEKALAFLDTAPLNPGHILLIPKMHIDYIFDLDHSTYVHLFEIARFIARPLQIVTDSKRVGIAVEGFGVPHAHLHLVPLNHGYDLDPHRAKKAGDEELLKMAMQIREKLKLNQVL